MSAIEARRRARERLGSDGSYAGDVTPAEAWEILEGEADAILIDVRTDAEWNYVGVPNLSSLGKKPALIAWQIFPTGALNPRFVDDVAKLGIRKDATVLLLCRTGGRSKAAAQALTAAGFSASYNVLDGFEGGHDANQHRGTRAGWKAVGLPWGQG